MERPPPPYLSHLHLFPPNKGKFLSPCNMFAWVFSWLPLPVILLAYPPPRLSWPEDAAIGINTDGCPSKQASTILFSSEFPASWGKNLAIPIDQTPDEGGEPAGSFCNLPLTWTQKTKVNLSAAGTQLPFMLPPGPRAVSSPALRPFCPGGAPTA